ncbi:MAG: zinc ABC transporter substrate-binding protein [Oscillospiraceae bacterium]|nr:zinc ABC transporter substrate-binding protein [Oscillospiraceae bacterium]
MKRLFTLFTAVFLLLSLAGCASSQDSAQIAATTLPVYEFTSRLCDGTGLSVTRLVTENVSCLHDYSLSVRQVKAVESAEVVILSGAGLEDFMEDMLSNAAYVIESTEGIDLLECSENHDHGHDHEQDPHLWLSPVHAKQMAQNICAGLKSQYPQHEAAFDANLTSLLSDLDGLLAYGQQQLQNLPHRELITFHDGFAYFAEAFDLTILEAIEEESGSEASAAELKHLITLVNSHELPAIFTERSGSVSAASVIAAETAAQIYALDMAMSGDSYFEAMIHNIDTVKEALG